MADDVRVTGLAELNKFLDQLPAKLARSVVRGALRAGIKDEILPAAKANIHNVSGELARSLDEKKAISTGTKNGRVYARLRAGVGLGVKGKEPANLPIWLEYGTAAHVIASRKGNSLFLGYGIFAKVAQHPGVAPYGDKTTGGPHAFMRPALDARAQAAVIAAAEYMKRRLSQKNGLDTSDIEIGPADE